MDRLEQDLGAQALVLRLNVMERVGREVMRVYRINLVPTFLVFDGAGNLIFRQGGTFPNVSKIKALVQAAKDSAVRPPGAPRGPLVLAGDIAAPGTLMPALCTHTPRGNIPFESTRDIDIRGAPP